MRLDEVAQELYTAPPGTFVAARNEYVRQAREAGDRKLAGELRALRRPTHSAWLVNLLLRERRELIDELLELGVEFRSQQLTRQRLHELSTRRRELLHQLQLDAQQLSTAAGLSLTPDRAREVEATLAAAAADPEAAELVRGGRLVTALSYSGLGPELQVIQEAEAASSAAAEADRAATVDDGAQARQRTADGEVGAAEEHEKQAATQRLVDEWIRAWEAAVQRRDEIQRRQDELSQRRDELHVELRRVQNSMDRTERELVAAQRDVEAKADYLRQIHPSGWPPS